MRHLTVIVSARCCVCRSSEEIGTAWYVAQKLKVAEQAAAEDVLGRLPEEPEAEAPLVAAPFPVPAETATDTSGDRNPGLVLNELTQAGLLTGTGYELLDQSGPSHQPTFVVVAWAKLPDGRLIQTEPAQGTSKKAAQRAAGGRLVDSLVKEGVTRG